MESDPRIKEAETYHTMGLFKESLDLYVLILESGDALTPEERETIEARVEQVRNDMDAVDKEDVALASQDVSFIKEMWSSEDNTAEIQISAESFRELGLYKEALEEYRKLLSTDLPRDNYLEGIIHCLTEIPPLSRVSELIDEMASGKNVKKETIALIQYEMAVKLEEENEDLALDLFKAVKENDPEFEGIGDRISQIESTQNYDSRYSYLLEKKKVTPTQLQQALALSKKMNKSVEFVLMEHFRVDKGEIGKSLELFYNAPFRPFDGSIEAPAGVLGKLREKFLVQNCWVPLDWELSEGVYDIYIDDPHDLMKTDSISAVLKARRYNFIIGIQEDIRDTIAMFFKQDRDMPTDEDAEGEDGLDDLIPDIDFEEEDLEEELSEEVDEASGQIVRMVDQVLISAYRKGASDIHFEPSIITKKMAIRFRIDGVCQDFLQVPLNNARGVMSRLKIMSGLDIAERRLPQDGKIKFKRKGVKPFELRLATLPTAGGFEDAVLRILAESGAMALDDMGLNERNLSTLKASIIQPYGLVLVVGPTGSGKTTTLHAALGHINRPGIKIWTAEDPVEITQQGLRQVECKAKIGLDFARVMRAFLRADPDVIMIGEMRDHETASIGVEASLTGHLVFSTLHTNSAPETITRLLDMGLNPLNFSDAFLGVLAQRLVRRICTKCKTEYHPDEEEFNDMRMTYGEASFEKLDLTYDEDFTLQKSEGCAECSDSRYKGRMGIHELMSGTPSIKNMIKKQSSTEDLYRQALADGMTTLLQDGISKVFQGMTDMEEIRRVVVS
jgi:type II secretory ATPase GspE/PulE/Tfp pilus assembly ATPase PilB-like protein